MDSKTSALDAILASGKQLALEIEQDVAEVDDLRPNSFEMAFRFRLRRIQKRLRKHTKDCLDYELRGAELLFHPAAGTVGEPGGGFDSANVALLQVQRDVLRRLLDALSTAVAELRGSYESHMTNLTNAMILVLTFASIVLAFRTLKVAQVTYDEAKADAAESTKTQEAASKKQEESTEKQIDALQAANTALKSVSDSAAKSARNAADQEKYLADQQLSETEKRQDDQRHELAGMFLQASQHLKAFYEGLEKTVQDTKIAQRNSRLGDTDKGSTPLLEERRALAVAMEKTAQLLRETSSAGRDQYLRPQRQSVLTKRFDSQRSAPQENANQVAKLEEETSELLSNYNLESFHVLVSEVVGVLVHDQTLYSQINEDYLQALATQALSEQLYRPKQGVDVPMIKPQIMSQLPIYERNTRDMVALWEALRETIYIRMATETHKVQPVMMDCKAEPNLVRSGKPILVTANVLNVESKPLRYEWKTNGGQITLSNPVATVNTEGLDPGSYTVQGFVSSADRAHGQSSCTAAFAVREFDPPTINCFATPSSAPAGTTVDIRTTGHSPQNRPLTYSFTTTAGHIERVGSNAKLSTDGLGDGIVRVVCHVVDDRGQAADSFVEIFTSKPEPTSTGPK